ncbi:hypothetical protein CEXT_425061 [Caerostris extrusa]|uniref:Uncharacterized protein n=1 Tax=Caerostris extrusa TaxID=172846 RepID=A0AAV4WGD0_CAEEX|nr:hypothetical protein CEXT_425061 [Caerostris extrusa]
MTNFPINWDLRLTNTPHPWRNGYVVSELILNNEWAMVTLWSDNRTINIGHRTLAPQYVEIYRKSTTGVVLVSGTLKLTAPSHQWHEHVVIERKIFQLMEKGSNYIIIELLDSTYQENYDPNKLTGNIRIESRKTKHW